MALAQAAKRGLSFGAPTEMEIEMAELLKALAQQPPGIKRTPLQKIEFPDGYVTVSGLAELPPGGAIACTSTPVNLAFGAKRANEAAMPSNCSPACPR